MCGIVGIVNLNFEPVDFKVLKRMMEVQKHRGPDDKGLVGFSFKHNEVAPVDIHQGGATRFHGGVGFNRLSILDLSVKGHQPMISGDGNVVIAYNGEIYNAFEFKGDLESKGYAFRSRTDTEILLNLYQAYGMDKTLDMVNGMFAFCLVDLKRKRVFLARDHAGIKPMYWYGIADTLMFASEVKSFLFHPRFRAEIEENHLDEQLYYKYCAHDRTIFRGVLQIPPAHYMEISPAGKRLVQHWRPNFSDGKGVKRDEALNLLDSVLKSAVQSQLVSDVKIGFQLSGGVDSSMVATMAHHALDSKMATFSVIPENKQYSEEKYMERVIGRTKAGSHKFGLTPEYFAKNLVSAAWHMDVPLPLPQAVGFRRLAKGASDFVTVLLGGEGSDELMGGYVSLFDLAWKMKNSWMVPLASKIPFKGKKFAGRFLPGVDARDYYIRHRAAVPMNEFTSFNREAKLDKVFSQREALCPPHPDLLTSARVYDMRGWLTNTLIVQDKMTMSHSLENRVPMLDKRVIDFVFSLPGRYFISGSRNPVGFNSPERHTKILLKELASRYYGRDFAFRKKMGFNQPMQDYFTYPLMKEMINDTVLPGIKTRGLVNYTKLQQAWNGLNRNTESSVLFLLWTCFSFEIWAQVFIDGKLSP